MERKGGGQKKTAAKVSNSLPLNEGSPLHIQEVSAAIKVTIEQKSKCFCRVENNVEY